MLRNSEVKREYIILIIIYAVMIVAGGVCFGSCGVLYGAVCGGIYILIFSLFRLRHYRRLANLSEDIARILHNQESMLFTEHREGELSELESQIKKLFHKLKYQTELLQKEKETLADAIADISHQIRTPLTSLHLITARLNNLKPDTDISVRYGLYRDTEQLLSHIDWLIESLLALARLDAGTLHMEQVQFSVIDMLNELKELFAIPMELRGQQLIISCDEGVTFNGDKRWTKEAIANLLKNCMEHTPEGGNIRIETEKNALYTGITIIDDGQGFAEDELPHLFERFYRGKENRESSIGIGLALARSLISGEGGTLTAKNVSCGGACFEIRLYESVV